MKLRLTATAVLEYDVNPTFYSAGTTAEQIIAIEVLEHGGYPSRMLDQPDTKWNTKIEEVKDSAQVLKQV